jgi:hypothetical protein
MEASIFLIMLKHMKKCCPSFSFCKLNLMLGCTINDVKTSNFSGPRATSPKVCQKRLCVKGDTDKPMACMFVIYLICVRKCKWLLYVVGMWCLPGIGDWGDLEWDGDYHLRCADFVQFGYLRVCVFVQYSEWLKWIQSFSYLLQRAKRKIQYFRAS